MSRNHSRHKSFLNKNTIRDRGTNPIDNAKFDIQTKEAMVSYYERVMETHPAKIANAISMRDHFQQILDKLSSEMENHVALLQTAKLNLKHSHDRLKELQKENNFCHNLTPIERKTRRAERLMNKLKEMGISLDSLADFIKQSNNNDDADED